MGLSRFVKRISGLPAPTAISPALLLMASLRDRGWHRSAKARMSVDAYGKPIPWMTYAAINWLNQVIGPTHTVFEYGAGQSTFWFAARAARVTSIESNSSWIAHIRRMLPANVELRHVSCDEHITDSYEASIPYSRAICDEGTFDLIIVDGVARNACVEEAIPHVQKEGIIVLDDADQRLFVLRTSACEQRDSGVLISRACVLGSDTSPSRRCTAVIFALGCAIPHCRRHRGIKLVSCGSVPVTDPLATSATSNFGNCCAARFGRPMVAGEKLFVD